MSEIILGRFFPLFFETLPGGFPKTVKLYKSVVRNIHNYLEPIFLTSKSSITLIEDVSKRYSFNNVTDVLCKKLVESKTPYFNETHVLGLKKNE